MIRWALWLLAALPAPALAQAYRCTPPQRFDLPRPVQPDGPPIRTPISGYTLAAS